MRHARGEMRGLNENRRHEGRFKRKRDVVTNVLKEKTWHEGCFEGKERSWGYFEREAKH